MTTEPTDEYPSDWIPACRVHWGTWALPLHIEWEMDTRWAILYLFLKVTVGPFELCWEHFGAEETP